MLLLSARLATYYHNYDSGRVTFKTLLRIMMSRMRAIRDSKYQICDKYIVKTKIVLCWMIIPCPFLTMKYEHTQSQGSGSNLSGVRERGLEQGEITKIRGQNFMCTIFNFFPLPRHQTFLLRRTAFLYPVCWAVSHLVSSQPLRPLNIDNRIGVSTHTLTGALSLVDHPYQYHVCI